MSTTQYVDVDRALELMDEDLDRANADAVRDFINHQAAENISEVQQQRQVYALRMLVAKFAPDGFQLHDATEDDLKTLIANMNRSDYKPSSKQVPMYH